VSPEVVGSLRPRFSPDGTRLAYLAGPDVRVRDIGSGRVSTVTRFTEGEVSDIAWLPDGRRIAVTAQRRAPYD
jgi:Tol biopolymer transport system component